MPDGIPSIDPTVVKRCAAEAFNKAWEFLDRNDRTQDDDDAMLAATFTQRHLWGSVGTPLEIERAEWQISRVYAVLGKGSESLRHAERCLRIVTDEAIGGFDVAFAHEAVARACSVPGAPRIGGKRSPPARPYRTRATGIMPRRRSPPSRADVSG